MSHWLGYEDETDNKEIEEAERRGAVLALRRLAAENSRWEFSRIINARADEIEKGTSQ